MQIQCPSCKKQYSIDGSKVTEQGVKIICPACKHQFIMRRKADEKPAKPEPQKPKTPPCAVCGAPSTHVFRGPPPRPLCEIHYTIENEKGSRFFEEPGAGGTTVVAKAPKPAPARPDPGRTSAAPPPPPPQHNSGRTSFSAPPPTDPGRTRAGAPPPAKPAARPAPQQVTEPPFDSFDDFDFSDLDTAAKAGAPRPGASMPGRSSPGNSLSGFDPGSSLSGFDPGSSFSSFSDPGLTRPPAPAGKPAPKTAAKPASKPADEPVEESFVSSAFDLMDDLAAANAAPPAPPPPEDEPADSDDPFRPEPAAPPPKKSPPPPRAAPTPRAASPARTAPPSQDSIPDFMPDPGEDEDMGFGSPREPQVGLDGAPIAPAARAAREETEDDFDFGWDNKPKAATRLDAEMEKQKPKAPAAPVVRPATRADYQAAKLAKPRSPTASAVTATLLLCAVLAAAFLGFSGRADQVPSPQASFDFPAAAWEGRLKAAGQSSAPDAAALPTLVVDTQGQAPAATAEENAQRAMQQALRDTAAGYQSALVAIDAALASEPDNGRYQAIKIDILAFREALAAGGQPQKAGASAQALAEANGNDPLLIRAKAHVFVNDQKTAAATALLNNYLAKNQQDGVAVFLLGLATLYQPDPDRAAAARLFEQSVTLEPGLARGYWELAKLYRQMGQYKAAIDVYNRILTSFPDHEGTADAMEETLREQKGVGPGGLAAGDTAPAITIVPQAAAAPEGIAASGDAISRNILEAIDDVEPRLRRVVPNTGTPGLRGPGGQPGQPQRPAMPKPPEEAQ